jgi:hypothetical protein
MLAPIGALVSEVFYPSLILKPGRPNPVIDPAVLPADLSHPLTWIETDGVGEAAYDRKISESGSRTNRVEANAIVTMLNSWYGDERFQNWMMTQTSAPIAIGIICMYAAQRDLIHRAPSSIWSGICAVGVSANPAAVLAGRPFLTLLLPARPPTPMPCRCIAGPLSYSALSIADR